MAIRKVRVIGDEILTKKAKEVTEVTPKISELIDDMFDTMYHEDGVGLAAPQVGILKRIVTIDVSEERNQPIVLINPMVTLAEGEQTGSEGCLSVPDKVGIVTRPNHVKVKAFDREMKPIELEGEELLARAFVHEIDHLEGQLYVDKVEGKLYDVSELDEMED